jgi:hypothetical protein
LPSSMAADAVPPTKERTARWWLSFVLTAGIPAATFYPFMKLAPVVFFGPFMAAKAMPFALSTFSEQITNQLLVWALLNGVISLLLSLFLRGDGRVKFNRAWLGAALTAIVSVAVGYLGIVVADRLFLVDFRFWVLGLKPFDGRHFHLFLIYLIPFTVFFLLSLRAFVLGIPVRKENGFTAVLVGGISMCLGFVVMLAAQFMSMTSTGMLINPAEALNTIIAYQFVPILAVIGIIAAYTYRWTNDYVPGAFICGLFVAWYIVAGTAVFPPTMKLGAAPAKPAAAAVKPAAVVAAPTAVSSAKP